MTGAAREIVLAGDWRRPEKLQKIIGPSGDAPGLVLPAHIAAEIEAERRAKAVTEAIRRARMTITLTGFCWCLLCREKTMRRVQAGERSAASMARFLPDDFDPAGFAA